MNQFSHIDTVTIRTELWNGKILIEFCLSADDLSVSEVAPRVLAFASRNSYLPLVCAEAVAIFRNYIVESLRLDLWFEHKNESLKWQYPIGILSDMYSVPSMGLPWKITLRFNGRNDKLSIRWASEQDVQRQFLHALKQAQYVQYHSTRYFNELLLSDQNNMWQAIRSSDYSLYSSSISNLSLTASSSAQRQFFNIPIRVMQRDMPIKQRQVSSAVDRFISSSDRYCVNMTRLTRPYMQTRLSDVLMHIVPYVFNEDDGIAIQSVRNLTTGTQIPPIEINTSGAKMSDVFIDDEEEDDGEEDCRRDDDDDDDALNRDGLYGDLAEMAKQEASDVVYRLEESAVNLILQARCIRKDYDVIIQGISVSSDLLQVPIMDLWKSLQHPDQFMYIIITCA